MSVIALVSLRRAAGRFSAASIAPIADFSVRFVRTVVLSHLLLPHELGAAIAMSIVFTTFQVLGDVGIDRFVMLHTGDAAAQAVAACNRISKIRGIVLAALTFVLAPWIAELAGAPESVSAVRWLAIVPLFFAFKNWGTTQIQTEGRFAPEAIAQSVAQVIALGAAAAAAIWLRDERAMVISLAVWAAVYAVLSHRLVPVRRVAKIDPAMRRTALLYGLPLMANGLGIVVLSQLDRYAVANLFGLEELALYVLALNLALIPISALLTITSNVGLGFLRRQGMSRVASLALTRGILILAAVYAIAIGACLDTAVPLLYGANFTVTPLFVLLTTLLAFSRLCRQAPNIVLMTHGATGRVAATTLIGGIGCVLGFLLALYTLRMEAVLFGVLVGDLLTLGGLFGSSRSFLPLNRLMPDVAWLVLPVALSAVGPILVDSFGVEGRLIALASALGLLTVQAIRTLSSWKQGIPSVRGDRVHDFAGQHGDA